MSDEQVNAIEERTKSEVWGYEQMRLDAVALIQAVRSLRSELESSEKLHRLAVKERNAAWKKVETLEKEIDKLLGG